MKKIIISLALLVTLLSTTSIHTYAADPGDSIGMSSKLTNGDSKLLADSGEPIGT